MTTRADALANTADGTDSIGDRKAENVAFTLGPWAFDRLGGSTVSMYEVFDQRTATPIADFIASEANAHLIASAPALYEALDRLLHETMFKDHPEASQMAIDALALARGEKK